MSEDGKKGGETAKTLGIGIHVFTKEQKSEVGKIGGSKSVIINRQNKVGIFGLSKNQLSENAKKANSQKWICLETGHISNAGGLSKYQKSKGIDTSKRERVS